MHAESDRFARPTFPNHPLTKLYRTLQDSIIMTAPSLPRPFKLERYFAQHEFTSKYPMCLSDCEPLGLQHVLSLADDECKERWENLTLGYTEADGDPILRKEIAKLYESVSEEHVTVMIPQEAISVASRAILEKGDHVICMRPAYQSLYELALCVGCVVHYWDCKRDASGALKFDVEDLKNLMHRSPKAVFINFPHNPTGCILSKGEWNEVISLCQSSDAILFSDEMYRFLELGESERNSSAVDCYDKAITLSGMSKSFSMAGIRLGWLVTKNESLKSLFQQLHDYGSICHVAPAEVLALIGLRNRDKILGDNLALIKANLDLAESFFAKHENLFEFHPPQGSSICFPRLKTGQNIEEFCDLLVKESGVLLLPATMYDTSDFAERGHFRLGLGRKIFAQGLEQLDKFLTNSRIFETSQ